MDVYVLYGMNPYDVQLGKASMWSVMKLACHYFSLSPSVRIYFKVNGAILMVG